MHALDRERSGQQAPSPSLGMGVNDPDAGSPRIRQLPAARHHLDQSRLVLTLGPDGRWSSMRPTGQGIYSPRLGQPTCRLSAPPADEVLPTTTYARFRVDHLVMSRAWFPFERSAGRMPRGLRVGGPANRPRRGRREVDDGER